MRIKEIGVDLDKYTTKKKFAGIVSMAEKRGRAFGAILESKKSKHGWHIKIKLDKTVGFWRSIEIRYYCLDDTKRMFFDIMRYRAGGKVIDVLFDKKKTKTLK